MKMMFKILAITAAAGLSFGSAEAKPDCKKINVLKKSEATISLSDDCKAYVDQLAGIPDFSKYIPFLDIPVPGGLINICYKSNESIPGKIGGKPVEMTTISALLAPGSGNSPGAITLYKITGSYTGELYASDSIHSQEGYEDEVFMGGSGDFAGAGGIGRLTFPPFLTDKSQLPPQTIVFTHVKGDVCFDAARGRPQ